MKNFVKAFFNSLYLSILLFFISMDIGMMLEFDIGYHFDIPLRMVSAYLYRFSIIISIFPFIIWGIKSLYYFFKKKKENILPSNKILSVSKGLSLFLVVLFFFFLQPGDLLTRGLFQIPLLFLAVFTLYLMKRSYGSGWGCSGFPIILFFFYLFLNFSVRCPPDRPLEDDTGECHSCNEKETIEYAYKCSEQCPNRANLFPRRACVNLDNCSSDKPLVDRHGNCYSCDYPEALYAANCSVCPNRTTTFGSERKCTLLTCPTNKPMRGRYGDCYSCDSLEGVEVKSLEQCSLCPNRRGIFPFECLLDECPENYPVRSFYGKCISCEEASYYSDRKIKENYEKTCLKKNN